MVRHMPLEHGIEGSSPSSPAIYHSFNFIYDSGIWLALNLSFSEWFRAVSSPERWKDEKDTFRDS